MKMTINVNGQEKIIVSRLSMMGLINELHMEPRTLLVELNGRVLLRHEWDSVELAEGDSLEIFRVSAGG